MTTFFNDFSDYLETVILCKEQLVIVGDFNIHVDVLSNSDSIKFRDLLESFCLQKAAWTIVTASYLEFLGAIFTNYRESRMQLHVLYSRRADFVISHLCSNHYTGCL